MRSRMHRRTRRFRANKREFVWVRAMGFNAAIDTVSGTGILTELILVSAADWARGGPAAGTLQKGCTLVRSIVQWCVREVPDVSPPLTTMQAAGVLTLRKVDQDDSAVLLSSTDLFDEDWMRLEHWSVDAAYALTPTLTWADRSGARQRGEWDSKVKRKLTSEDQIRFGAAADVGGTTPTVALVCDFLAQFLLQLP